MTDADPVFELARAIRDDVARIAADPGAHTDLLREVFDRADRDERARLARRIFDTLDAEQQWNVLGEVFGDDELRDYLAAVRDVRRMQAAALTANALDTSTIEQGRVLVLGLFREAEARAAVARGHRSNAAARRLALRSEGGGEYRVLEDVFNPSGGYFVTAEYSEQTWQHAERLESHTPARIGSLGADEFAHTVFPGGRVDFIVNGEKRKGYLHLGFVTLDGIDVFAP